MKNHLTGKTASEKSKAAVWLKKTAAVILWFVAFLSGAMAAYGLTQVGKNPANAILVAILSAAAWYGLYFGGLLVGRFRSSENPQMRFPVLHWAVWTLETFFALFFASMIFSGENIGLVVFCLILGGMAGVSAYRRGKRLAAHYRQQDKTEVRATAGRLTWSFVWSLAWSASVILCLYALLRQAALPVNTNPAAICFILCLTVLSGCAAYRCWKTLAKMFQKYAQQQKSW